MAVTEHAARRTRGAQLLSDPAQVPQLREKHGPVSSAVLDRIHPTPSSSTCIAAYCTTVQKHGDPLLNVRQSVLQRALNPMAQLAPRLQRLERMASPELQQQPNAPAVLSVDAVNFVLIESLFTDSLKREVEERQIDVLSKLTRVYSSALMPQEHVSPIGRMLVTVIERLDETGSPGFAQVIEKLVAACIHHFSQLNPEQMQIEGMIAVLLSQNLSPSCKKMIIKSVAAHDLETHFSILVQLLPTLNAVLPTTQDPKPILKLLMVWADVPGIHIRLTLLNLSPLLRGFLQHVADPVVRLLAIQLATKILIPAHETISYWLPVLHAIAHDHRLTNDVLLFLSSALDEQPGCYPDLIAFVVKRTTYELPKQGHARAWSPHTAAPSEEGPLNELPTPAKLGMDLALESKLAGLQLIEQFLHDDTARSLVLSSGYIDFCVGHLTFSPAGGFDQGWPTRGLKAIQATALVHLATIFSAGDLFEEVANLACDPVLVTYLREALAADNGIADRPNTVNLVAGCVPRFLHLVRTMCTYGADVQTKLGAQGLVHECMSLISSRAPAGGNVGTSESTRQLACVALAALCEGACEPNQLLVASIPSAVYTLAQLIPWSSAHPPTQLKMRIAVLDALWSVVTECHLNEESFLEAGGIFKLFALIADPGVERNVMAHALALILEMLENPKTRQHVVTWSNASYASAPALLLSIWRRENSSMEFNRHLTAIEEMGNNFCCKIYGILSHIGFHTMYEGLNEDDRRLLYGIERYLDFKIGVIWDEIAFELQSEGIRPVSPDQQVLDAVRAAVEAKTAQVQRLQRDSTREFTERKSAKEGEFFSIFMHSHHLIKEPATMAPRAAPAKSSSSPIEGQSMTDRGGDIAPPQQGTKAKRRVSLGFLDVIAPEKEAHQTVASGRYKGLAHASVVRMAVPDDEK